MSHAAELGLIDNPTLSRPTKKGIMVISEMPSYRIVGFLMHRHRVGLLFIGNLAWISWEVYNKAGRYFF